LAPEEDLLLTSYKVMTEPSLFGLILQMQDSPFHTLWLFELEAPIFGSLCITPSTQNGIFFLYYFLSISLILVSLLLSIFCHSYLLLS
jgi:hypothetical protein